MLALLVVGGLFWAKYNVTTIKQWRDGNAWYLGYEAAAVRYRHNPDRFKKDVSDERLGTTKLPWRSQVSVNAGATARLEVIPAQPPADQAARGIRPRPRPAVWAGRLHQNVRGPPPGTRMVPGNREYA
ncbi:hypothetical protein ABZ746_32680 [Streptomyces sp. NPDC020096]